MYTVLSRCYQAPDTELLSVLNEARVPGLDVSTLPELLELQQDYARLFVGPFGVFAPPYGSVYLERERRVHGDSTADVMRRYREEGLRPTLKEPADHVALELEYMYLLVFLQMEADEAGDHEIARRYLEKQYDFLRTHLAAWMPQFLEQVAEKAETDFYDCVATLTDQFIAQDLKFCAEAFTRKSNEHSFMELHATGCDSPRRLTKEVIAEE